MTEPTFDQKMIDYLKSALSQRGPNPFHPDWVPARIRLTENLRGDWPVGHMTMAVAGIHMCQTNVWGAMFVKASCGAKLGVKLDECEILDFRLNEKKRILASEAAAS